MMNYSGSTKKKANSKLLKNILISWLVVLLIGTLTGAAIGRAINRPQEISESEEKPPLYGTRDGRSFTDGTEMSVDWANDLDFKPLDVPLDEDVQEFAFYLSYAYYIDFPFVMALMETESSFRTDIISKTNDTGLMQINSCNHEWLSEKLGITDFNDPYQNIRAGLYILRNLFEKYDDPSKVLMAYNMGEYGASVLWEQGIMETNYSKKILTRADEFEALLKGSTEND